MGLLGAATCILLGASPGMAQITPPCVLLSPHETATIPQYWFPDDAIQFNSVDGFYGYESDYSAGACNQYRVDWIVWWWSNNHGYPPSEGVYFLFSPWNLPSANGTQAQLPANSYDCDNFFMEGRWYMKEQGGEYEPMGYGTWEGVWAAQACTYNRTSGSLDYDFFVTAPAYPEWAKHRLTVRVLLRGTAQQVRHLAHHPPPE